MVFLGMPSSVKKFWILTLWSPWSWMTLPASSSSTRVPLQANSYRIAPNQYWLEQVNRQATPGTGTGARGQGEHTFLKALRSFLESYSGQWRTNQIRLLTMVGMVPERARLWEDLATWSMSCGHFVVGYECGCNSVEFLLPHY